MAATKDIYQYIGVNLGGVKTVTGIVLQGREDVGGRWVTKYKVAYKQGGDWKVVRRDANHEEDMVSLFEISFPFYNLVLVPIISSCVNSNRNCTF